jgi:acyl transferase domain-containing protein
MAALAAEYLALLQSEDRLTQPDHKPDRTRPPLFSSVTAQLLNDTTGLSPPYYWAINLVSPVRFSTTVSNLLADNAGTESPTIFREIGPHSALAGPLRQIYETASKPCNYIPSQIRGKDSVVTFLLALGKL